MCCSVINSSHPPLRLFHYMLFDHKQAIAYCFSLILIDYLEHSSIIQIREEKKLCVLHSSQPR